MNLNYETISGREVHKLIDWNTVISVHRRHVREKKNNLFACICITQIDYNKKLTLFIHNLLNSENNTGWKLR